MKAHLVISESPLADGSQVDSLCGQSLYPAQIVYMWDSLSMGQIALSTLLFCRKCLDAEYLSQPSATRRYIYGVMQKAKK